MNIANDLWISKREYIWVNSHDVSIAVMQILEQDFGVSKQPSSVCERGQQRAFEASKAMNVTKIQESDPHSHDQYKVKPRREDQSKDGISEIRVGQNFDDKHKGERKAFESRQ